MSLVPPLSNDATVTPVTRNDEGRNAPLSNAERQRLYRERKKLKRATKPARLTNPSTDTNTPEQTDRATQRTEPKRCVRYSDEIANIIIARLEAGESLKSVCSSGDLPDESSVRHWAADPTHPFSPRYARAREVGWLKVADEVLHLADGLEHSKAERHDANVINRDKLRYDARRWMLSKVLPKIYGDRIEADITSAGQPLQPAGSLELAKALLQVLPSMALPAPEPLDTDAVPVTTEGSAL